MKRSLQQAVAKSFQTLDPALPFADRVRTACRINNVPPPKTLYPSALKWLACHLAATSPIRQPVPRARATQTATAVSLAASPAPSTAPHLALADAIGRLFASAAELGQALGESLSAQLLENIAHGLATTDITALAVARIERELADPATFDGRKSWLRDQLRVLKDKLAARQAAAAKEK